LNDQTFFILCSKYINMKFPIKITQNNTLTVYWKLTDFCNFKCNYCPAALHSGNFARGIAPGFPTDAEIFKFLDRLEFIVRSRDLALQVQFGGGEPTLHPLLPDIIKRLKHFCQRIGVTTNGSRPTEWWQKVMPLNNVTISLHHEFTNMQKVNELGNFIVDNNLSSLEYHLSCDPNYWTDVMHIYDSLDDKLKPYVSPKVLNSMDSINKINFSYTDTQKEWIEKIDSKYTAPKRPTPAASSYIVHFSDGSEEKFSLARMAINDWNRFKGWKCNVTSECITVNFNGKVSAGVCEAKLLGTLTTFSLDNEPLICPFSHCAYPGDMRSSKEKIRKVYHMKGTFFQTAT